MSHRTSSAITDLHHVGVVVRDIEAAREVYARLGFTVPQAAFPALPPAPGEAPRAFGAGNTHAYFTAGFVELATVLGSNPVEDGDAFELHVIDAPEHAREQLMRVIDTTSARLQAALDRREGLHILAFASTDIDATSVWLDEQAVSHGGVQRLQRPIETDGGVVSESVGYLELDDPARTPEGRLAVAEYPTSEILAVRRLPRHNNGAQALARIDIAVPDAEADRHVARYRRYLGRQPRRDGANAVFDLDRSQIVLTPTAEARGGGAENSVDAPALIGYAVEVRDLSATADFLGRHDVGFERTEQGLTVSAAAALGASVEFVAGAR